MSRRVGSRIVSASEEVTRELGRRLAALLRPDRVLLLHGEMGAGKTVLTQGIASGLGVDPRLVQSPTFTLIHEYPSEDVALIHVDLYRLEAEEVAELGLDELLGGVGVKVVEWAERLVSGWPEAVSLRLELVGPESRALVAMDEASEDLMRSLQAEERSVRSGEQER